MLWLAQSPAATMSGSLVRAWSSITTPLSMTQTCGGGKIGVRLNADADNDEVSGN